MQSVKMRLVIGGNGDQQEVELTMIKRPTKRVITNESLPDNQGGKKHVVSSTHVEFSAAFHLSTPASSSSAAANPVPVTVRASDGGLEEEGTVRQLMKSKSIREHPSADLKRVIQSDGKQVQYLLTMDMLRSLPITLNVQLPPNGKGKINSIPIGLGSHSFSRVVEVEASSKRDCTSNQWGQWSSEEESCTVVDFLHELCFRISSEQSVGQGEGVDGSPSISLSPDGGRGCDPGGKRMAQGSGSGSGGDEEDLARRWKRARLQPAGSAEASASNTGGTLLPLYTISSDYLEAAFSKGSAKAVKDPSSSSKRTKGGSKKKGKGQEGVPKVVILVKHSMDPQVLEKTLIHAVGKRLERATFVHALGLSLIFLGLCTLVVNAFLTVPALVAIWKQKQEEEEEEEEDSK